MNNEIVEKITNIVILLLNVKRLLIQIIIAAGKNLASISIRMFLHLLSKTSTFQFPLLHLVAQQI
jgi:hypothetical protein